MKNDSDYWNRIWQERREMLDKADAGECALLWADPEAARRFLRAFEPLLTRDQGRYWVEEWADFFSYSWPGGAV
jgi:hypothetical protein